MAERRATNKYYPPNWNPSKGSLNKFHGQHPLRDRARKLDQGILIVRFEMPYNIWCDGCKNHIGKGVRYNAEKKAVGNYFSTKIWKFRMKCHLCPNYIEVQTDPKNSDYVVVKGATRKTETWDGEENGTYKILQEDEAQKLAEDPFYKLEYTNKETEKVEELAPVLADLQDFKETRKDDFGLNQQVRKIFRTKKKEQEKMKNDGVRIGLNIPLLPLSVEDIETAQKVKFTNSTNAALLEKKRKLQIKSSSIFGKTKDTEATRKAKIEFLAKKRKTGDFANGF